MKRILLVDDDTSALQGTRRLLRSINRDWQISLAESGPDALALMEREESFDLLVSDIRMPGMDGIELLKIAREQFPMTARFALSGQSDSLTFLKVATVSHQFISKPCHPHRLGNLVARTLAIREHLHNDSMRQLLLSIGALPSVPGVYQEIMEEIQSEDPSIRAVGEIIKRDVAMSAKLLQIVNSAYMGLGHEVSDPVHAVSLLGMENVRNIALSAGFFASAAGAHLPAGFDLDTLWHHSLQVAEYAKRIAEEEVLDKRIIDHAFTAGLLHEAGQIILATQMSDQFAKTLKKSREERILLFDAERDVFGCTHAQLGGCLLELWGLPDPVVEAIAFHDFPSGRPREDFIADLPDDDYDAASFSNLGAVDETKFTALTAVHVANYFCTDTTTKSADPQAGLDAPYLDELGFSNRLQSWFDLGYGSG